MIKNALVLFITCAGVFVLFLPSYIQMQEMNERNNAYQRQIKDLTLENAKLSEERRRLIDDPEYLERVARRKFGIIKEGETIYKILPSGTPVTKKPEPDADDKPKATVKPAASKSKTVKKTASTTKSTTSKKTTPKKTVKKPDVKKP
jgi:cell division protein FtsB